MELYLHSSIHVQVVVPYNAPGTKREGADTWHILFNIMFHCLTHRWELVCIGTNSNWSILLIDLLSDISARQERSELVSCLKLVVSWNRCRPVAEFLLESLLCDLTTLESMSSSRCWFDIVSTLKLQRLDSYYSNITLLFKLPVLSPLFSCIAKRSLHSVPLKGRRTIA
jgi:hypothetical protein